MLAASFIRRPTQATRDDRRARGIAFRDALNRQYRYTLVYLLVVGEWWLQTGMEPGLGERFLHSNSTFWTITRVVVVVGPLMVLLGIALLVFLRA